MEKLSKEEMDRIEKESKERYRVYNTTWTPFQDGYKQGAISEFLRSKEEIERLKERINKLEECLEEMFRTLKSDDTQLCQVLPTKDSFYKPDAWLKRVESLIEAKP